MFFAMARNAISKRKVGYLISLCFFPFVNLSKKKKKKSYFCCRGATYEDIYVTVYSKTANYKKDVWFLYHD